MSQAIPRSSSHPFESASIGKLIITLSVPLVLSLFVQVLYGLIDSFYIAKLGNAALTAISLSMPVQYLISGVGAGIGIGINSLISKKLGQKDPDGILLCVGNGLWIVWIASILFALLGMFAIPAFFEIQTDLPDVLEMSITYSRLLCIFACCSLHQVAFERMLSASGKTIYTMISMTLGAVINLILDPLFIFGWQSIPAMGIAGAAYATVLAQAIAALVGFILNRLINPEVPLKAKGFLIDPPLIIRILSIAVPVAMSQSMVSVLAFGMNNILLSLSALAPAVYVVYVRLQTFALMPANGMSDANVSIIAYHYGARQKDRITQTLRLSILFNAGIALLAVLIVECFPAYLLGFFEASEDMLAIGVPALRIIGLFIPIVGTTNILRGCLQALGRGKESVMLALLQAILLLAAAWLLSFLHDTVLIWYAFPIMETMRFLLAVWLVYRAYQTQLA